MQVLRAHDEIRDANIRYHDVAASGYDAKWGIDFGPTGQSQVLGRWRKLLGTEHASGFEDALEIGCGTGYFSLNLMLAGMIGELTCSDISQGMLDALGANAQRVGLAQRVCTVRADAESLPFANDSFDLVVGHAVLHHLPDLDQAFSEFKRVLRPGGRIVFAGEPSRLGDWLARVPKRAARIVAPTWRRMLRAGPAQAVTSTGTQGSNDHELETEVDVHAFTPSELTRVASEAGFQAITVRGEELLANWFGWFNRGLEFTADPDDVPTPWRKYAFHGYVALQKLDALALEPRLPAALFYNLLLTARKPVASSSL